jgi:hypothetical protein
MNIKELAEQANGEHSWPGGVDWVWDELERFAELVAAHEREECAKVCDRFANRMMSAEECAGAIRERGKA